MREGRPGEVRSGRVTPFGRPGGRPVKMDEGASSGFRWGRLAMAVSLEPSWARAKISSKVQTVAESPAAPLAGTSAPLPPFRRVTFGAITLASLGDAMIAFALAARAMLAISLA